MPFNYEEYDAKCAAMTHAALQKEWEKYTRKASGGTTGITLEVLATPLTMGASLLGVGFSGPQIYNARKKLAIIEKHMDKLIQNVGSVTSSTVTSGSVTPGSVTPGSITPGGSTDTLHVAAVPKRKHDVAIIPANQSKLEGKAKAETHSPPTYDSTVAAMDQWQPIQKWETDGRQKQKDDKPVPLAQDQTPPVKSTNRFNRFFA